MLSGANDVWVVVETDESGPLEAGLEALSAGRELADQRGGGPVGVLIGSGMAEPARRVAGCGVDGVLVVDDPACARYATLPYTHALAALAEKYRPDAILMAATHVGRDLAPRLACRLKTGLIADCAGIAWNAATNAVDWICPAFGGKLMAAIGCPDHRPQLATIPPGAFAKPAASLSATAAIITEAVSFPKETAAVTVLERIVKTVAPCDTLGQAKLVVGVGRGIGGPAGVEAAKRLAAGLGAGLGATRPVVERGWLPPDSQIGQTGEFIRPEVYFACGISGAVQHTVGIRGSGMLVAINNDATAPIFDLADFGIVADVRDALPLLLRALCPESR